MTLQEKILEQIDPKVYGPEVIDISYKIYGYLIIGKGNLQYISLGILREYLESKYSDGDIILTTRVLSILRYPILLECYELVENEECFQIEAEEIHLAMKEGGELFHPYTGNLVNDFQRKINVFYKPTQQFLSDLAKEKTGDHNE